LVNWLLWVIKIINYKIQGGFNNEKSI